MIYLIYNIKTHMLTYRLGIYQSHSYYTYCSTLNFYNFLLSLKELQYLSNVLIFPKIF